MDSQKVITDDLDALLEILPPRIAEPLSALPEISELLEVVIDLGRPPEARFPQREVVLDTRETDETDIEYVVARIGDFGDDNRAGIERTLHRISAIRNRKGRIVGLTCRVGRAVFGTIKVIEDLIQSGNSVLLLGRPGVGKTTMLREVARVLAGDMNKRVIIVDTSNEIAGDGDIPHPAIGHARRMQVTTPTKQHAVMIEAVENHMPEVIVIDEIGTELEALAARTIAERGVQLVGTAHGNNLDNLMMNPTLADLVGGIQSVTLGDEEARRRRTQKSILERKSPPTFDVVVEIQDRDSVRIHTDVGAAVDALLRGIEVATEVRRINDDGTVQVDRDMPEQTFAAAPPTGIRRKAAVSAGIFAFGVNRARLEQQAREMGIDINLVNGIRDAGMLVTSRNYYRRKPQPVRDAEASGVPVYVLKSNTPAQMRQFIWHLSPGREGGNSGSVQQALAEAEEAVTEAKESDTEVELEPQGAYIRRLQHLIAERNEVRSKSAGRDPNRRVRIFRRDSAGESKDISPGDMVV
ncbi:R3H domain-containing nucleic acid-binding protein [Chloroflexota bacterium]